MDALHEWDKLDPLNKLRAQFHIPEENGQAQTYLNGNSLGLQPVHTKAAIERELDRWKTLGIDGYFSSRKPWITLSESLQEPLAEIVGARPLEVVAMNSLGVNLHLMLASFYQPKNKKTKIIIEADAFPTDRYSVASHLKWHNIAPDALIEWPRDPKTGEYEVETLEKILADHKEEIALALLPGVQYLTGEIFDIEKITQLLHAQDIIAGWDLAHAVGNIPLNCHQHNIDFAVWCHYKYMNSGPGAIGGCFIHETHAKQANKFRLAGWWGNDLDTRFEMLPEIHFYPNALGWQISNLSVLSAVPLEASLDIFHQAGGMKPLREKSQKMMQWLCENLLNEFKTDIQILTPMNPDKMGCQMTFTVVDQDNQYICERLKNHHVVTDFRHPKYIRVAFAPLYNRFAELGYFINTLHNVLEESRRHE